MIIDFHIHNQQPDFENMDQMLRRADYLGIKMMGNLGDVLANGLSPTVEAVKAINDRTLALDKIHHKKLFSFCFLNPANCVESSLAEIERCMVIQGINFVGIKFEAALNCRDKKIDPIMEKAEKCLLTDTLLFITIRLEDRRGANPNCIVQDVPPEEINQFAREHPKLRIVCLNSAFHEVRVITANAPNIYIDTAYIESGDTIQNLMETMPVAQIIFGSHTPFFSTRAEIMKIQNSSVNDQIKSNILAKDIKGVI